ncbi:MAG: hypothetical protein J6T94_01905 [Bacteroidaceae bacterium]|nr:hypothetical protein [Bacteroidaceae bacterium]
MKTFSRTGYARRKKNYEEGKNIFGEQIILFGEQISRDEEGKNIYRKATILFTLRNLFNEKRAFIV